MTQHGVLYAGSSTSGEKCRTAFHYTRLAEHLTPYDPTTQVFDGLTGQLASCGLPPGVAEDRALKLLGGTVQRQATMMTYNDIWQEPPRQRRARSIKRRYRPSRT